ncbi:zinc ABC transporter substrate-binding protein [bacterium]|nr:zinc ABC transporter substrate-binding protein [bacterium]
MRKFLNKIFIVSVLFFLLNSNAQAKPNVVASTADMASIAKYIAGDLINIKSIFYGQMDIHFFQARPRHILWLSKADLFIAAGLGGDGWIYPLLTSCRNPKIQPGKTGFVDPSSGVKALDIPTGRIDGSMGHVHPYGNPHYWFTEKNLIISANNITAGLINIMPDKKNILLKNKEKFVLRGKNLFAGLRTKMKPFKGSRIIQYHESWNYFCSEFGFDIVGSIEPKPGISPTPGHIAELKKIITNDNVNLIIAEPYYPKKPIDKLTGGSKVNVVRIALYLKKNGDILKHISNQADQIIKGLNKKK